MTLEALTGRADHPRGGLRERSELYPLIQRFYQFYWRSVKSDRLAVPRSPILDFSEMQLS